MVFLINGTGVYRSSFETFLPNSVAGFQVNGPQHLAVDFLCIYQEPELNRQLYSEINSAKIVTCSVCNGEGVTRRAYKKTVADYEYTLGVKVVQSGSTTSTCGACGGCGLGVR